MNNFMSKHLIKENNPKSFNNLKEMINFNK